MATGSGANSGRDGDSVQGSTRAEGWSRLPVDQLIRELIRTRREATPDETAQIIERIATAPFDARVVSAPTYLRGLMYGERTVQTHDESAFLHLVKCVLEERQWADGTTVADYVEDLRRAVRHPGARVALYAGRSGPIAATVSNTDMAVPERRRGEKTLSFLIVIYSVDRGVIITGYQFSDLSTVRIPKEALWLR
ncbi:MAG: hypothetical protein ACRDI2_14690 [Chloroflexota bacterium]